MKMYNEDNIKEMTVEDYKLIKAEIERFCYEDYNYKEKISKEEEASNLGIELAEFISYNESGEFDEYYKKADKICEDIVKLLK